MREITIILTKNVNITNASFDTEKLEIYKFDKNESNEEELKKIVVDINKSQNEIVYLITNKENLFESFNRQINCIYSNTENYDRPSIGNVITFNSLCFNGVFKYIRENIFFNINQVLNNYGNIFDINIEKLVKGTTYKVGSKDELIDLINEDLNLISFKQIITSRLAIVLYRLRYFDLDASIVSIGRFFSDSSGKSKPFKINLNRNSDGYFFTDLNNKIFRGYKIKTVEITLPDDSLDLKIKIAKKLLRNKVKIEIVAESLDIPIEKLNDMIYGNDDNKIDKNSLSFSSNNEKFPKDKPMNILRETQLNSNW